MESRILFCFGIFFLIISVLNIFQLIVQKNSTKKQLKRQNKDIIFINSSNLNIKKDCYPTDDFFKMHDAQENCYKENDEIKYIRYTNKSDFYI